LSAVLPSAADSQPRGRISGETVLVGIILLAVVVLIGLPMLFVVLSALLVDPFAPGSGFTWASLAGAYGSPAVLHSLWQTVALSIGVGLVATAVGGAMAWLTVRVAMPSAKLLALIAIMPLFMSPLVAVIAWIALAAPHSGIVNDLLAMAGAPDWLRLNIMSMTGIVFVMTSHYVPYGYLFVASGLRNVDASLEEASYMAGAGVLGTALRIVLPLLRAPFLSSVLFIAILTAGEFSVPSLLGGRTGFVPLSVRVYEAVNGFPQDFGRAAAIGTMLIAISIVAFYFYRRSLRDGRRFITLSGKGYALRQIDPGVWRLPILGLFGLYALLTVILPYIALVFIALSEFRSGSLADAELTLSQIRLVLDRPDVRIATTNTLAISVLVPIACVILALLLVYANDRQKMRGSSVAVYLASIPIAVSGIVFASGVLVAYITTPLYGTLWLIGLGLIAHYLTHAIRITGNGLGQIDPALEEAARVNGAGLLSTIRTIVAPLIAPSLWSAMLLIFIFCTREVNTAIMLYSPGTQLLSVLSWNYAADGELAPAAVVGLIQTGMMIGMIVLARIFLGVSAAKDMT
jgi:iron(III) transport system permease protein